MKKYIQHRSNVASAILEFFGQSIDQRFGRIIADEILSQLVTDVMCGRRMLRQDIESLFSLSNSRSFKRTAEKNLAAKIVAIGIEKKAIAVWHITRDLLSQQIAGC